MKAEKKCLGIEVKYQAQVDDGNIERTASIKNYIFLVKTSSQAGRKV